MNDYCNWLLTFLSVFFPYGFISKPLFVPPGMCTSVCPKLGNFSACHLHFPRCQGSGEKLGSKEKPKSTSKLNVSDTIPSLMLFSVFCLLLFLFSFGLCLCFIIWFWAKEARFQLLIGIRTALLPLTMKFIQSFYLAAELREPKQKDKYTKLTRTQVKMSR